MVLCQFIWIPTIFGFGDLPDFTQRDWIQFFRTGNRIAEGLREMVYVRDFAGGPSPEFEDRFFFLYPPFVAWITVPLAPLGRAGAYLACIGTVSAGTLLATLGFLTLVRASAAQRLLGLLGLLGSAPWNAAVFLGHLSALLLLSPTLSVWARSRKHPVLAGCCLGILLAKPNWGLPVLGFLLLGQEWKMVAGFLLTGAVLVLLSLPLGPELWGDWWETMVAYQALIAQTAPEKQFTLLAAIRSLTGEAGSHPLVLGIWFPFAALLMGWMARLWFKIGRKDGMFPRLLALSFLAILVANPYAHIYDIVLLTPAALILWISPSNGRNTRARRWALGTTIVTYYLMYLQLLGMLGIAQSLTALALAAWLILELVELEGQRLGSWIPDTSGLAILPPDLKVFGTR